MTESGYQGHGGAHDPPPPDKRLWVIAGILAVIAVVAVALLLTTLGDDDDSDDRATTDPSTTTEATTSSTSATTSTSTTEVTTTAEATTTTAADTTTTEVTPSTVDPADCTAAGTDPSDPERAAEEAYTAWTRGDAACAQRLMTQQAFDTLFARSGAGASDEFQGCWDMSEGGGEPLMDCAFTYEGGATHYMMQFSPTDGWLVFEITQVAD